MSHVHENGRSKCNVCYNGHNKQESDCRTVRSVAVMIIGQALEDYKVVTYATLMRGVELQNVFHQAQTIKHK